MKQTLKLALLCTVAVLSMHAKKDKDSVLDSINQKVSRIRQIVAEINSKQECTFEIRASDIGTTGYTITQPGTYCLVDDVVFSPSTPAAGQVTAAITIASSRVTLLMNGHRLTQAGAVDATTIPNYSTTRVNQPSSQAPFVVGILIPDVITTNTNINAIGLESIYIDGGNGIIDGFSMYGIRAFAHIADLQISNVTVSNCGVLASLYLRPTPGYFPHNQVSANPLFGPSMGVGGVVIGESTIFGMGPNFFQDIAAGTNNINRLSNVYLDNVHCFNNFSTGLMLVNATNVVIDDCTTLGTFCDDPGVAGASGYRAIGVAGARLANNDQSIPGSYGGEDPGILNMSVRNCMFNSTKNLGDYQTSIVSAGFAVANVVDTFSRNVVWENCQFNNAQNTFLGSNVSGYLSSANEDSVFINCNFDNQQAVTSIQSFHRSGTNTSGVISPQFYKPARNLVMINCTANNNRIMGHPSVFASRLFGFALFAVKNATMIDCAANDNISMNPVVYDPINLVGMSAGFRITTNNDTILPNNGATDLDQDNTILQGCFASRNQTFNGGPAVGFLIAAADVDTVNFAAVRSVLLEDCEAFGNVSHVPPSSGVVGTQSFGAGFYIQQNTRNSTDTQRSFPGSLINCKAYRNLGAPSVGSGVGAVYSSGFYLNRTLNYSLTECEALNNIYGFLLQGSSSCALRDNRADNNLDLINTGSVGCGFVDLGLSTVATLTAVGQSTSWFESNHAYNNGLGLFHNASNGNGNYNVIVDGLGTPLATYQVQVSNPAGSYTYHDPAVTVGSQVHNISTIK